MGAQKNSIYPRLAWKRTAIAVVVAHLILLVGLDRLTDIFFGEPPKQDPNESFAVQMLTLPAASPPARPPLVAPGSQTAGDATLQKALNEPAQGPEASQTPQKDATTNNSARDLSQRTPQLDELPRVGGVALSLYWGDHPGNTPIAKGSIELSFPGPDRYRIRLLTKAQGWASVFAPNPLYAETVGRLGPGGFQPERYTHRSPRGKEEVSEFDYENKKITYSSLKTPLPLPNGIQDRLSFMIQLAWMMKIEPDRFTLGESIMIPMAGRNKVEDVSFTVMSDADVVLPGGVLVPAVHLSSFRKGERFGGQIDVWLDRTDRLLPVRIRFEEARGQVLDMLTVREP